MWRISPSGSHRWSPPEGCGSGRTAAASEEGLRRGSWRIPDRDLTLTPREHAEILEDYVASVPPERRPGLRATMEAQPVPERRPAYGTDWIPGVETDEVDVEYVVLYNLRK